MAHRTTAFLLTVTALAGCNRTLVQKPTTPINRTVTAWETDKYHRGEYLTSGEEKGAALHWELERN